MAIRNLGISGPKIAQPTTSLLRLNVIVISKYDFEAKSPLELSVKKGDVLKLLDKMQGGWVLVKCIDKVVPPGLVPLLFVDIAVNDPVNPITLAWLHDSNDTDAYTTSFHDAEVQVLIQNNTPVTINNEPYPILALISNFLLYDNRYWYRVDITYSTGEKAYLCRYYQDFYQLHTELYEHQKTGLPKLPEPIPLQQRPQAEAHCVLVERCKDLNRYVNELIANKRLQVSPALLRFLLLGYHGLPGFKVLEELNEENDKISFRVLPGSKKIYSQSKPKVSELEAIDAVMDKREEDDERKKFPLQQMPHPPPPSKNIYNHYQQVVNALQNVNQNVKRANSTGHMHRYPVISPETLGRLPTVNTPARSNTISTKNAGRANGSPPVRQNTSQNAKKPELLHCRLKTQGGDTLVVRLNKQEIRTPREFKRQIYSKLAFNNVFVKLASADLFEELDDAVFTRLLRSDQVEVLLT